MQYGLWIYPWDVVEQDSDSVLEDIKGLGIDEINLATNYHAVQSFHPHHDSRGFFFTEARAYYSPDDRFGELRPVVYEEMNVDWTRDVLQIANDHSIDVNSWTIGCHNSALGARYPEYTTLNCFDDRLRYGICPSQPAVQDYLVNVVGNLSDEYDFRRIELESFDYFYGTGFGWHHSKYHAHLGRLAEFLLGLCFCDACEELSPLTESEIRDAKQDCKLVIRNTAEGELPPDIDVRGWLAAHPNVTTHAKSRERNLNDLYRRLNRASGDCELVTYIGLLDIDETWIHGIDLDGVAEWVDAYTVMAYESSPEAVTKKIRTASDLVDTNLHVGLRPGYPEITDKETLARQVKRCTRENIERISFYHYGMLPQRNLEWIGSVIRDHR